MLWALRLVYTLFLLNPLLGKPAAEPEEDCQLSAHETMHDFCCELHDESPQFGDCEMKWHDKIHYTSEQEEHAYMFCVAECTYNSTEYLNKDRQSLNLRQVREHLEGELADDAEEALLYQTYVRCEQQAKAQLSHKNVRSLAQRVAKYGCHVYPGLVMECVANEMILNCPPKRYHDTAQCQVTREHLRKCQQHKQ